MKHAERAMELYQQAEPHHNCCQSVLIPYAEELGLDQETFYKLAAQFGSGMRRGSVCGAVTGGLMAIGLLGGDGATALEFQRRFRERAGAMDCAVLLKTAKENGEEKGDHCGRMVAIAADLVDELMGE